MADDTFETHEEHRAYLDWLDAQDDPVDEDHARSAWAASRAYHRAESEREIAASVLRIAAQLHEWVEPSNVTPPSGPIRPLSPMEAVVELRRIARQGERLAARQESKS